MELLKVRGGTREELFQKKYNICIGISLGNKWFSVDNITSLIKWALKYTREYVIVCPADDIHAINIEVRKRVTPEKALRIAKQMGQEINDNVKNAIENIFSEEEKSRIKFATWTDVVDDKYVQKVKYLYSEYETNTDFRNAIQDIVRKFVSKENRQYSDQDITKFGTYIIEELPEVMTRVSILGITCDAYVYPFDGDLTRLIDKIQIGELFSDIKEKIMDTEPKVFLEVR